MRARLPSGLLGLFLGLFLGLSAVHAETPPPPAEAVAVRPWVPPAQSPDAAAVRPTPPPASPAAVAARDTIVIAQRGQSLLDIAAAILGRDGGTGGLHTVAALAGAIRQANDLDADRLVAGQALRVPLGSASPAPVSGVSRVDTARAAAPAKAAARHPPLTGRGLYATAAVAGSRRLWTLVDSLVAAGGNTLVFDIKDRPGDLSYRSAVPLARATQVDSLIRIRDPARLVAQLQQRGLHVVARISCFYDERIAGARPDLAPRHDSLGVWGEGWLDPAREEVQTYVLDVAEEVAAFGVDEIQLDYVRFPTEPGVEQARFAMPDSATKHSVITAFVQRARRHLGARVMLSADLFGVTAWGRQADVERTGQHLPDLIPLLDVVCPMLYPSHFYGNFAGIERPADYPYHLVHEGVRRVVPLARAHAVAVRPWVQAFPYRVSGFSTAYVTEQLQAADDAGADGWLLWHPSSRYDVGLQAIREVTEGRARAARLTPPPPADHPEPDPG